MREEQQTIRDLHDSYRKQLRTLEVKEERLLDLATDAELPRTGFTPACGASRSIGSAPKRA